MIRHICMFTLKEENKKANMAEFFKRADELKKLDMIQHSEVVKNADRTPASNYDVALIFDFETVEALDAYRVSPTHVAFGKFVTAIRVDRACIDYEF